MSSYRVKNVVLNNNNKNVKSRVKLLHWVNNTLKASFKNINELSTGAAYCQLLEMLFPGTIALNTIYFFTNLEHESFQNFKTLQSAFRKLKINHEMRIDRIAKGQSSDNLEFLQWFERFFEANYGGTPYDPVAGRSGRAIGYGPTKFRYSNCYSPNPFTKAAKCAHEVKRQKSFPCVSVKRCKRSHPEDNSPSTRTLRLSAGSHSEPHITGKLAPVMYVPSVGRPFNTKSSFLPVPVDRGIPCSPQFDEAFLATLGIAFTPEMTRKELNKALEDCLAKVESVRNKLFARLLQFEQSAAANRNGPHASFAQGMLDLLYETTEGFACPTED